jgi:hypothetical protein
MLVNTHSSAPSCHVLIDRIGGSVTSSRDWRAVLDRLQLAGVTSQDHLGDACLG